MLAARSAGNRAVTKSGRHAWRAVERVAAGQPLGYGRLDERMGKFILNSVMLGTLAIPIIMALRLPANARGTRQVTRVYLAFSFLYIVGVLYVMPRL